MKKSTKLSLLGVLAVAALAIGWTSAGDVKITGSLLSKVQRFYGATGTNFIKVPDNLASALIVEDFENGLDILSIATTNSSELITVTSPVTVAGATTLKGTTINGSLGVTGTLGTSGAVTFNSTLAVDGVLTESVPGIVGVSGAITAAGSAITDCTQLTAEASRVGTATSLQGVCLVAAVAGKKQMVTNNTAVSIMVYPKDSDNGALTIPPMAALGADVGFAIGPGGSLSCQSNVSTFWRCVVSLGVTATLAGAGTTIADFGSMLAVSLGSHVRATGGNGTVGITLPEEDVATCIRILNGSTAVLKLSGDPGDSDTIAGGVGDAEFNMGAGASWLVCTVDGSEWLVY